MKLNLKNRDFIILALIFLAGIVVGSISYYLLIAGVLTFLFALLLEFYYRIKKFQENFKMIAENNYKQIEAYNSFIPFLNLKKPLPPMRKAAISPDAAKIIVDLVLDKKPKTVVEFGSGVSTIIIGYLLKDFAGGKIISLEHNKEYAEITRNNLKEHELEEYTEVIYAPLEVQEFNNEKCKWYKKDFLDGLDKIDLVIVDGPPRRVGDLARYPALPALCERLNTGAIIIADDAKRPSIQRTIDLWREEHRDFDFKYFDTEKGTAILRKK